MKVILLTVCITSALAASMNGHNRQKRHAGNFNHPAFQFPMMNIPFDNLHPNNPASHSDPLHPNVPSHQSDPIHPTFPPHQSDPFHPTFPPHQSDPLHPTFPPHQSFYDDYYNHLDTHFLPNNHKCVKPYDLAAELNLLSDNADGYPLAAIDLEKTNRPDLAAYLPAVPAEPSNAVYEVDPNYSCPTMKKRLRSFSGYGGQCWILDEIVVDYGYCMNAYCDNHQYGSSLYTRNMCMEHFDTVYVWAYCDNYQDPALRIRQETIRIPKYCSCKSVRCV